MAENKDRQVKRVVEGMAVAVLAAGVEAVTSGTHAFKSGFNTAWSQWAPAARFPSISGMGAGNLFWIGVGKSARRQGAFAAWEADGRWTRPVVLHDWELDEVLDELADDRVSADEWRELGRLYVATFEPDELLRAS